MSFYLSDKSRIKLLGVHPDLCRVVERAIGLSKVDFAVVEGLRSPERQKMLVGAGASRSLNSRHLTGHAVDLGGMVDGKVFISWNTAPEIAVAMRKAAVELKVPLVWGACWDRSLNGTTDHPARVMSDYTARWRAVNMRSKRGPLLDGPHFELDRAVYPA